MPMPQTYQRCSEEWRSFLDEIKGLMDLDSNNMAYTAVDAVLQVFRKRLTPEQGIVFASALPTVLRAIFVKDWDVTSDPLPFPDRRSLIAEIKAVRPNHNLTPDNAIEAVRKRLAAMLIPWSSSAFLRRYRLTRGTIGPSNRLESRLSGLPHG